MLDRTSCRPLGRAFTSPVHAAKGKTRAKTGRKLDFHVLERLERLVARDALLIHYQLIRRQSAMVARAGRMRRALFLSRRRRSWRPLENGPMKMPKLVQVGKYLVAGATVFCVSWLACVGEWHARVRWAGGAAGARGSPTIRTIVAYSAGKRAELDRATPVTCDRLPAFPEIPAVVSRYLLICP